MISLCLLILPLYFVNTGAFYAALLFWGIAVCGCYVRVYYVCQLKNGGVARAELLQTKKYYTANAAKPQKCEYTLRLYFRNGKAEPMVLEENDLLLKTLRRFPGFALRQEEAAPTRTTLSPSAPTHKKAA